MGIEIGSGIQIGPGIVFNNITVPSIGDPYGGGFFAGQISVNGDGVATHNLVIGPKASAEATRAWKTSNTSTTGTSSTIDGPANTNAMNDAAHPAALFCKGLTVGGFSDWYLPAKDELEIIYYNLKPGTAVNSTTIATNAYSVPRRNSNYTASVPAQTIAASFQTGGAEALIAAYYWSSTQVDATSAWGQRFIYGDQEPLGKNNFTSTRAIRRVAI
jgi:hypothetical protein